MAELFTEPVVIEAAGTPTKLISEFVGRVASSTDSVSIAVMDSPAGWSEPGQTPEFDEYTLVLEGSLAVETRDGSVQVTAGQALHAPANEWVRYSTPDGAARYVSVCIPAFSPGNVHRDD
ncbi:MAG TPA: cupin [Acidimicrobiia bacterium]|jgi:quercetin dioxygenase-like cupin family protein|nr:cupin [Acidimicrobiia bacterium]